MRADESAGTDVRLPEAVDRHGQLTSIPLLLRQFAGARIGLSRLRRFTAFGGEKRQAARQLQLDFPSVASPTLGQSGQCRETAFKVAKRFKMG